MTFFRGLKPKKQDVAIIQNGVTSNLQSQRRIHDDTDTHFLNEDNSSPSSDHRKRKHIKHLRSITAEILKEQISVDTSLKNRNRSEVYCPNDKNTTMTTRGNNDNNYYNYDFAKIEPWVESPSTNVQQSGSSNSISEERTTSTICSAFEMLSFDDYLCNGTKTLGEDGILDIRRDGCLVGGNLKVLGRVLDFPHEINLESRNSRSRGHGNLREKLAIIHRRRKSKILQKLLHLKPPNRVDRSTKVTKVKVYIPIH
mmetsp:Transcript_10499/g.12069  ORF Transcript_10499/g.12069 Transcript_10499/m.12069 type:complete len:255 (-) Transcript_10499:89-853(-)